MCDDGYFLTCYVRIKSGSVLCTEPLEKLTLGAYLHEERQGRTQGVPTYFTMGLLF
jgi:hypothetical protein